MKLIVSEMETWRRYVSREFYHVMTGLINDYGWRQVDASKLWNARATIKETLVEECGEMPEVVLFWEEFASLSARAGDVTRLNCRKCFFGDDVHWGWPEEGRRKFLCFALFDTILTPYAYAFERFYPQLAGMKRVEWVPHSASPDFMLTYNDRPENAILLSGCLEYYYPFRQQMKRLHERGDYPIHHHPHPGYGSDFDYDNDGNVGQGYAAMLRAHRACLTDSTKYRYVVAKYFEIPATGALLLADDAVAPQLRELGLAEYRHYIPVSADDLEEKVRYVLDEKNHGELDEIRRRGQQVIRERHRTSDRVRLIDEICTS